MMIEGRASNGNLGSFERIELIDALRAVALLGVILMNVGGMAMRFVGKDLMMNATTLDLALVASDTILVMGKARSCFAFLFGLGFGILLFRAGAERGDFKRYFTRRMLALLAFGVVNQVFLFWGDILMAYALLGLVLMAIRHLSAKSFLQGGLSLILLPPLVLAFAEWLYGGVLPGLIAADAKIETARAITALTSRDYLDAVAFNATQNLLRHGTQAAHMIVYELNVLGLFMLGVWSVRSGLVHQLATKRRLLKRVMVAGLMIGLPLNIVNALPFLGINTEGLLGVVVTASYPAIALLAFGYIAALTLAFGREGNRAVHMLAPAGRMALTNYLASGAIGGWIFYGYGLGLLREVSVVDLNLIGVGIFIGLAIFSHLWLLMFRYGPVEWLWRSLSHGRWQPMSRAPRVNVAA
jgi:uncharacterized protein